MGIPMIFIRTNRCNLRCNWCDSTYTFTGGYERSVEEIIEDISKFEEEWICLTGGEPLLQNDYPELLDKTERIGKRVLVETSGSLPVEAVVKHSNATVDMDVKTPSSGEENSLRVENLSHLRKSDYIKFVIKDDTDYNFSKDFIQKHRDLISCEVVFQPAWGTDLKWLAERVLNDKLNVRVLPQLHKIIWGEMRGV